MSTKPDTSIQLNSDSRDRVTALPFGNAGHTDRAPEEEVTGGASEHDVLFYLDELIRRSGPDGTGRLPTERQLAQTTGANRNSVRKALTRLEVQGRIIRHVGRGTFVAEQPNGAPPGQASGHSPISVLEVRMMLEPQVAAAAALAATQMDLQAIKDCQDRSKVARDYDEFELWDSALHRAISESTHSALVVHFLAIIDEARQGVQWGTLKRRAFSPERRAEYEAQHDAIVKALFERDADGAAAAMESHLQAVRRHLVNR